METEKSKNIMTMIFNKTEFTDKDYISIGEHFERLMSYDTYGRGNALPCLDCEHCIGDEYEGIWVYSCERSHLVNDDVECSKGYCPYRKFGKDIVELLNTLNEETEEES